MPIVTLGNTAPIEPVKPDPSKTDIKRVPRPDLAPAETTWVIPPSEKLSDAIRMVATGFPSHHSDEPPAWVECDDPVLREALAQELGCPVGRPEGWKIATGELTLGQPDEEYIPHLDEPEDKE